jgi:hypothetical protein
MVSTALKSSAVETFVRRDRDEGFRIYVGPKPRDVAYELSVTSDTGVFGVFAEEVIMSAIHNSVEADSSGVSRLLPVESVPVFVCGRLSQWNTRVLDAAFLASKEAPMLSAPSRVELSLLTPLITAYISSLQSVTPTVGLGLAVASILRDRDIVLPPAEELSMSDAVDRMIMVWLGDSVSRLSRDDKFEACSVAPDNLTGMLCATLNLAGASCLPRSSGACAPFLCIAMIGLSVPGAAIPVARAALSIPLVQHNFIGKKAQAVNGESNFGIRVLEVARRLDIGAMFQKPAGKSSVKALLSAQVGIVTPGSSARTVLEAAVHFAQDRSSSSSGSSSRDKNVDWFLQLMLQCYSTFRSPTLLLSALRVASRKVELYPLGAAEGSTSDTVDTVEKYRAQVAPLQLLLRAGLSIEEVVTLPIRQGLVKQLVPVQVSLIGMLQLVVQSDFTLDVYNTAAERLSETIIRLCTTSRELSLLLDLESSRSFGTWLVKLSLENSEITKADGHRLCINFLTPLWDKNSSFGDLSSRMTASLDVISSASLDKRMGSRYWLNTAFNLVTGLHDAASTAMKEDGDASHGDWKPWTHDYGGVLADWIQRSGAQSTLKLAGQAMNTANMAYKLRIPTTCAPEVLEQIQVALGEVFRSHVDALSSRCNFTTLCARVASLAALLYEHGDASRGKTLQDVRRVRTYCTKLIDATNAFAQMDVVFSAHTGRIRSYPLASFLVSAAKLGSLACARSGMSSDLGHVYTCIENAAMYQLRGRYTTPGSPSVKLLFPGVHLAYNILRCYGNVPMDKRQFARKRFFNGGMEVCTTITRLCTRLLDSHSVAVKLHAACEVVSKITEFFGVKGAGIGILFDKVMRDLAGIVGQATLLGNGTTKDIISAFQLLRSVIALGGDSADRDWARHLEGTLLRSTGTSSAVSRVTAGTPSRPDAPDAGSGSPTSTSPSTGVSPSSPSNTTIWTVASGILEFVEPRISAPYVREVVGEMRNVFDAWSLAQHHVSFLSNPGEGLASRADVVKRVVLMAWASSIIRIAGTPSLGNVFDSEEFVPMRAFSEVESLCPLAEWMSGGAGLAVDGLRSRTALTRAKGNTWFVGLGDKDQAGDVKTDEWIENEIRVAKEKTKRTAAVESELTEEMSGQIHAAKQYHLSALAGLNAVRRVFNTASKTNSKLGGSDLERSSLRLNVIRCAKILGRSVVDFCACMDIVYSVRGRVRLPGDEPDNWAWKSPPVVVGLPQPLPTPVFTKPLETIAPPASAEVPPPASAGAPVAPSVSPSVSSTVVPAPAVPDWLTDWEYRMLTVSTGKEEFFERTCPLELHMVILLGMELLKLLNESAAELGIVGKKDSQCPSLCPTVVAWLKERAMDVGQVLVRFCQHARGDNILPLPVEKDLKELLSKAGVSTSRVQQLEEFDFDVPSIEAREETFNEAVAAADKARFDKLVAVVTEAPTADSLHSAVAVDFSCDIVLTGIDDDPANTEEQQRSNTGM